MLPEPQTIALLSQQLAPIAELFIENALQPYYSADVTVTPALVASFIVRAKGVVAPDYAAEVLATREYLCGALRDHHINTCGIFFAKGSGDAEEIGITSELPNEVALDQNYPNPFNPSTTISFSLPMASNVNLTIYNVLGQRVATLVNNHLDAGSHTLSFNAAKFASGVYFYRLEAGSYVALKKMMLLK